MKKPLSQCDSWDQLNHMPQYKMQFPQSTVSSSDTRLQTKTKKQRKKSQYSYFLPIIKGKKIGLK